MLLKEGGPNEGTHAESSEHDLPSADEHCLSDDEASGLQKDNELTVIKISKGGDEEELPSPHIL